MEDGGWKKSEIWDALKFGSKNLPLIDPFADIKPMDHTVRIDAAPVAEDSEYDLTTEWDTDSDDSEWKKVDGRNDFDIFD